MKLAVCIAATKGNSDLFKFLRYLKPFLKYKGKRFQIFYSAGPKIAKNVQKKFVPTLKCCRKVSFEYNSDLFFAAKSCKQELFFGVNFTQIGALLRVQQGCKKRW